MEAFRNLEASVNHDIEKAAVAAQWFATKLIVQKLQESHTGEGATIHEPLVQIEREANLVLKKIQEKNYRLPDDPLNVLEIVILINNGVEKTLPIELHLERN